jgi:hypothetical protein
MSLLSDVVVTFLSSMVVSIPKGQFLNFDEYCIRRAVLLGVSRQVLVDLSGHALEPTRSSVGCEMTADTPHCVEIIHRTFIRTL